MPSELRTPQEWAALDGLLILDPDGWRYADAPPFDQPTTHDDYMARRGECTIGPLAALHDINDTSRRTQ